MSRSGLTLDVRYRLEEFIAAGGVGQVWRGTDLVLERPVAVKLLRPEYASHPETLERFRAEARHAGALTHPCIAQVYDYADSGPDDSPYLVMELIDGSSLADILASGTMDVTRAMDIAAQVAAGLAAAHRSGLVHRDIKPANILVRSDGLVKITDFGIAHAAGSAPLTAPEMVMGTAQYLAPERITGAGDGPAGDLYSLGIVLYECLAGLPPFAGSTAEVMSAHLYVPLPPLPSGVPPAVSELVIRLTEKDPAARLSDAAELEATARRLSAGLDGFSDAAALEEPARRFSAGRAALSQSALSQPAVSRSALSQPALSRPAVASAGIPPQTARSSGPVPSGKGAKQPGKDASTTSNRRGSILAVGIAAAVLGLVLGGLASGALRITGLNAPSQVIQQNIQKNYAPSDGSGQPGKRNASPSPSPSPRPTADPTHRAAASTRQVTHSSSGTGSSGGTSGTTAGSGTKTGTTSSGSGSSGSGSSGSGSSGSGGSGSGSGGGIGVTVPPVCVLVCLP